MNKEEHHENRAVTQIKQHQFLTMIIGSIIIAIFLVFVALSLYVSSGTIQLDLSRPGYAEARKESQSSGKVFRGFADSGEITSEALAEFDKLYKGKLKEATSVKAYSGDALSDETMQLAE